MHLHKKWRRKISLVGLQKLVLIDGDMDKDNLYVYMFMLREDF
jgi:hypothetical protein